MFIKTDSVCIKNEKLNINVYSYQNPVTWHASLPPPGTAAQIIRGVIPPNEA
jgi:hypothetical protein